MHKMGQAFTAIGWKCLPSKAGGACWCDVRHLVQFHFVHVPTMYGASRCRLVQVDSCSGGYPRRAVHMRIQSKCSTPYSLMCECHFRKS